MSKFAVEIRRISEVSHHPNADRLDIAKVDGLEFQFITGRDEYKQGDEVVYFPIDSILPDDIIARLGLEGRLSGPEKNRVKTIRLRSEISQGIVGKPEDTLPHWLFKHFWYDFIEERDEIGDIAERLGVTKYEPPEVFVGSAKLTTLPPWVPVYDIEGADRHPRELDELKRCGDVWITEKLEGTNFAMTYDATTGEHEVCTRKHTVTPLLEEQAKVHTFHRVVKELNLVGVAHYFHIMLSEIYPEVKTFCLRGELIGPGIQGNIYKLEKHQVRFFDALLPDRKYLSSRLFQSIMETFGDFILMDEGHSPRPAVPEIFRGPLSEFLAPYGGSVKDASNGRSVLNPDVAREGIVIKPWLEEIWSPKLQGRLMLKQRSPEYLAKSKL